MKENHIYCEYEKTKVIKSIYCPELDCKTCPHIQHTRPISRSNKNKKFASTIQPITDNRKFSPKSFRLPSESNSVYWLEWSDIHYNYMLWLCEEIKKLKNKRDKSHAENNRLEYWELLYELGVKGFNISEWAKLFKQITSAMWLKEAAESCQKSKMLQLQREKDYKRIMRILDKYCTSWSQIAPFKPTVNNPPLLLAVKDALKDLLCKPNNVSTIEHLKEKNVDPNKKNILHWPVIDNAIKILVKDLIRIGYSGNSACKYTSQLLKHSGLNMTHHAIKERYRYQKQEKEKTSNQQPPLQSTYKLVPVEPETSVFTEVKVNFPFINALEFPPLDAFHNSAKNTTHKKKIT